MWGVLALILVVLVLLIGCAVAIGHNSVATVSTRADADVQREVAKDSATIEDVLAPKENRK
jgi:hypothetical protein